VELVLEIRCSALPQREILRLVSKSAGFLSQAAQRELVVETMFKTDEVPFDM
jgi:hypothetical protein